MFLVSFYISTLVLVLIILLYFGNIYERRRRESFQIYGDYLSGCYMCPYGYTKLPGYDRLCGRYLGSDSEEYVAGADIPCPRKWTLWPSLYGQRYHGWRPYFPRRSWRRRYGRRRGRRRPIHKKK